MRQRKQAGQIVTIGDAYYVRYWQRSNVGGQIVRKRCSRRLGEIPKGYRSKHPPDDIIRAAADVMKTVTDSPIPAGRVISLADFAENIFLPLVKEHLRRSTYRGYTFVWLYHLKPGTSRYRKCLKDVRTYDVQNWLDEIARVSPQPLHKNTLLRIKSVLSALFREAKRLLNNTLARAILPALNRCVRCGVAEGKPHLKKGHDYERDERIPQWRGWHACRRGLASNLNRLGVDDSVIQRMLRHSNVNITQSFYIKSAPDDVRDAMEKIEQDYVAKTAVRTLQDSDRTLNQDSGATSESVN